MLETEYIMEKFKYSEEKVQEEASKIKYHVGNKESKNNYGVAIESIDLIENDFESLKEEVHYDKFINNISQHIENEEFEQAEFLSEKYFEELFELHGCKEYSEINNTIKEINQKLIENGKEFIIHPDLYDTLPGFTSHKYNKLIKEVLGGRKEDSFEKDENGKIIAIETLEYFLGRKTKGKYRASLNRYTNVTIERRDREHRPRDGVWLESDRYEHLDSLDVVESEDKYGNFRYYDTAGNLIEFKYIYSMNIESQEYRQISNEKQKDIWRNKKIDCEKVEELNPMVKEAELVYPQIYLKKILKELNTLLKKDALRYVNLISIDKPRIVQQKNMIVDTFSGPEKADRSIRTLTSGYYTKDSKILGINPLIDKQNTSLSMWKNIVWHEIGHSFHVCGYKETDLNPLIEEFFRLSKQNQSIKDCVSSRDLTDPLSFKRFPEEDLYEDFAETFSYYRNKTKKKNKSDLFYKKIEIMRKIFSTAKL